MQTMELAEDMGAGFAVLSGNQTAINEKMATQATKLEAQMDRANKMEQLVQKYLVKNPAAEEVSSNKRTPIGSDNGLEDLRLSE